MRRSGKLLAFGGRKSKYTTAVKMASGGGRLTKIHEVR